MFYNSLPLKVIITLEAIEVAPEVKGLLPKPANPSVVFAGPVENWVRWLDSWKVVL